MNKRRKWYKCDQEGCTHKSRSKAIVGMHKYHVHGIRAATKPTHGDAKCPQCDYVGSTFGMKIHMSRAHGIRGVNYEVRKTRRESNKPMGTPIRDESSSLMVLPPQKVRKVRSVAHHQTSGHHWKFCPSCGTDLENLMIRIAATMSVTNAHD